MKKSPPFCRRTVTNIAVDTNGSVYVTHYVFGGSGVEKFSPSEFPVTATTTYTSAGVVDVDAIFALAIDPANNDLYTVKHPEGESVVIQRDEGGDSSRNSPRRAKAR